MDIKIEKKPWYIRHRYYLLGGTAFVIFLIYVISLSFDPANCESKPTIYKLLK